MSFLSYLSQVVIGNKGLSGLSLSKHREVYDEWRRQISLKKYPMDLDLPWLTIIAKNYMEDFLKGRSGKSKVCEFGSGGSSVFFLKNSSEVVSVEHNKEWFEMVKTRINELGLSSKWNGNLIEPETLNGDAAGLDIANPQHYYSDDDNFKKHTFRAYSSHIDKYADEYFDLVLVDGRSRPGCVAHSLAKVKRGGLLVLDNAERTYYTRQLPVLKKDFRLVRSAWGALICSDQFTQTNVYQKL
jgi:hypothetical protein